MAERVDAAGAAFAGSQLQIQLYVNRRTVQLDSAIRSAFLELHGATFKWRSPLTEDRYREYADKAFLETVGLGHHAADLAAFWPRGGPRWDALATVSRNGETRPGVLLVEGKSYPSEMYGSGTAAVPKSVSRALIEKSLGWTQEYLGVEGRTPVEWCGPLYQSANRLAHMCWLRSLGVRAWLLHVLFTDDPHSPTTMQEWLPALERSYEELGLPGRRLEGVGHVLLPAGTRDELVEPSQSL